MEKLLMNPKEAAGALNFSERTLARLTKNGAIPSIKIGRLVRYDPADLQAWIDRSKQVHQRPTNGLLDMLSSSSMLLS